MSINDDALAYHEQAPCGKVGMAVTKPCATQRDLSLAYTPGVAAPCKAIEKDPELSYRYTSRGNLVAVISNGTAVLGLGDIGALAGKPVMEGKGVLFKRFAGVDVFDLEIDEKDPEKLIAIVKSLEPTFGGINLEDIKAPECFRVETECKRTMGIPVFHDDQHGTAIISAAGLINAAFLQKKEVRDLKLVFSGAGAAAISCASHYLQIGVRRENVTLVDTKGVVYKGRTEGMNAFKQEFAQDTRKRTLAEALEGADMFCGLSSAGLVTPAMVKTMAARPIVFAMANPDPEIPYPDGKGARPDIIMATGRSDYPNQVNNVLGFPFIFRGALDVRASQINDAMKVAATHALAKLTRTGPVPANVLKAYNLKSLEFGPEYIIPKPLDPRVLVEESSAVAKAAMDSGVARKPVDLDAYRKRLEALAVELHRG